MSCEGCVQQIKETNEAVNKVYKDAQQAANETGHWYGLYFDEFRKPQYIRADFAGGYNVFAFVSPRMQDA